MLERDEMKIFTADELARILVLHNLWREGEVDGVCANLKGANLKGANLKGTHLEGAHLEGAWLEGANLKGANLVGAHLEGAHLEGAWLEGAWLEGAHLEGTHLEGAHLEGTHLEGAWLPTGETWREYLDHVVPALLTTGGNSIAQIVESGAWQCHSWDNCPMAIAFNVHKPDDCPILLRPRVRQFVQLFDAGLIPVPLIITPPTGANNPCAASMNS
jgi:hypothetical protein